MLAHPTVDGLPVQELWVSAMTTVGDRDATALVQFLEEMSGVQLAD